MYMYIHVHVCDLHVRAVLCLYLSPMLSAFPPRYLPALPGPRFPFSQHVHMQFVLHVHIHCRCTCNDEYMYIPGIHVHVHVLMRVERRKEERSKQGQTNNKAKQHSTPKAVTFPKKNYLHVHVCV